jgi:hypothetical protein
MVDPTLTLVLSISICKKNMGTHRVLVSEHAVPDIAKIKKLGSELGVCALETCRRCLKNRCIRVRKGKGTVYETR